MKKTYAPNAKEIVKDWHFMDANGKILGRLATDVSKLLIGKHKAIYTPGALIGDKVVITNASKIAVTGNKMKGKQYFWHTSYPGALRSMTLEEMMAKDPRKVVRLAVRGMLPKNKLRKKLLTNLYIYADEKHAHAAQESK